MDLLRARRWLDACSWSLSLRDDVRALREDVHAMTVPSASPRPPFPQEHEEIVSVWHRSSGLAAVIAIHSTVRGPALGGCRFRVYPTLDAAVAEAGRLSEAMTFKSALAGLPFGGGKAVLIGNPASAKTKELLFDYAEVLNQLGGRYVTAEDVGTTQADMDTLRERTKFVAGTSVDRGGSGDPSPMTAYGVLCAMQATANHLWGSDDLTGKRVAISGVGKVGSELARLPTRAGLSDHHRRRLDRSRGSNKGDRPSRSHRPGTDSSRRVRRLCSMCLGWRPQRTIDQRIGL